MKFTKMHGAGNDYIYINCFSEQIVNAPLLAKALSDRHIGVGGDGLVLIMPSAVADVRMRMFNADGSEAEMCGNAIRCVGKFAYDKGICSREQLAVETLSGVKEITLSIKNGKAEAARVNMGRPNFDTRLIPMSARADKFIDQPVTVGGNSYRATALSMGNPHWVFFTDDVSALDLQNIGPAFENHALFPKRVNTGFAQITGENRMKLRVYERGSGETMACGTGACAAAVAASVCERTGKNVTIELLGGELFIEWDETGFVYMTGNAVEVFTGEISL